MNFTQVTLDELLEEYQLLERLERDIERQIVRNQQLFEKHDTLQAQLVRTSNTFEQAVAIIDHNIISLKQTQTEQNKKARIRAKFQRWLVHYYNRVNYVRTDYYYPRPQDRWANRTFFLGSFLLFGKGIIPIFKTIVLWLDLRKTYFPMLKREGFYNNDPDDMGGETYRGVARNYHPQWEGWAIVDARKQALGRPLRRNERIPSAELDRMIWTSIKRFSGNLSTQTISATILW